MSLAHKIIAPTVLAFALFAGFNGAAAQEQQQPQKPQNQQNQPSCERDGTALKKRLHDRFGLAATGETAVLSQFNAEIYANEKTGYWTLLGTPVNEPPGWPEDGLCGLLGQKIFPGYPHQVHQEPWYKQNFTPKKQELLVP